MKLKDDSVDIEHLHPEVREILPLVETFRATVLTECRVPPSEMVVTSGAEGEPGSGAHNRKSRHYPANTQSGYGEAVDIRANDLTGTIATELGGRIAHQLRLHFPGRFKCFLEDCLSANCHIHIQLESK